MASSELLKQIQAGKRLKKAETHDRSAPAIAADSKPSSFGPAGGSSPAKPMAATAGPPQLGGLFAGGMPKLKPAGQSGLGM
jgi:WH2 motif